MFNSHVCRRQRGSWQKRLLFRASAPRLFPPPFHPLLGQWKQREEEKEMEEEVVVKQFGWSGGDRWDDSAFVETGHLEFHFSTDKQIQTQWQPSGSLVHWKNYCQIFVCGFRIEMMKVVCFSSYWNNIFCIVCILRQAADHCHRNGYGKTIAFFHGSSVNI